MAEQRTLTEMLHDLGQTQQTFLDILSRADEQSLYRRSADDGWTLAEILAHIAEARRFFTAEAQKVLATPGIKMGRTINHPGRLQAVQDHGRDLSEDIRHQLVHSYEPMIKTLEQLVEADLQLHGEHVKYGVQTLAEFIQHFMVEHDQAHAHQAAASLEEK